MHCIIAYSKGKEIADLQFSMNKKRTIYNALDCQKNDNGCSGNGETKKFNYWQLKKALQTVEHENEADFLKKIIKKKKVKILFG